MSLDEPIGRSDERYQHMLTCLGETADTLERGMLVEDEQLEELREAARRLRRAIEAHVIQAATFCQACGNLSVPLTSGSRFCSDPCRATASAHGVELNG